MCVRARFKVDVQRAAPGAAACYLERLLLSVWLAGLAVVTLAREAASRIQHHRAHHRIGAGPVLRLAGKVDGARRPMQIGAGVMLCG